MEQYIPKSALVAEIVKRIAFHHKRGNQHDSCVEDVLYGLLYVVNTLEVKETDFIEEELPISHSLTEEGLFTFKDGGKAIITRID